MIQTALHIIILGGFVLSLLMFSLGEFVRGFRHNIFISVGFAIGSLALIIRLILTGMHGSVSDVETFRQILLLTFALTCLYSHLQLMRTMMLSIGAFVILAVEMLVGRLSYMTTDTIISPIEPMTLAYRLSLILSAIGFGMLLAGGVLGLIYSLRRQQRGELPKTVLIVNRKMGLVLDGLLWLTFLLLSIAFVLYSSYSLQVYGSYWQWQPLYAVLAGCWLVLGIGKYFRHFL